jgi:hypothetical protein
MGQSDAGAPSSKVNANVIGRMAEMLVNQVPHLRGAIALVDSPRWPSDLDYSREGVVTAARSHRGREIDVAVRGLVSRLRESRANSTLAPVAMFPTPPLRYFAAHLNSATCKPHLRKLGEALFGEVLSRDYGPPIGGVFTRFMIAGFATYQALRAISADTYESYPDLQFGLWCRHHRLISKNCRSGGRVAALASRIRVLLSVARQIGVHGSGLIKRIDEADAAILVLSVVASQRRGTTIIFQNPCEGRFIVAVDAADARRLQQGPRRGRHAAEID